MGEVINGKFPLVVKQKEEHRQQEIVSKEIKGTVLARRIHNLLTLVNNKFSKSAETVNKLNTKLQEAVNELIEIKEKDLLTFAQFKDEWNKISRVKTGEK